MRYVIWHTPRTGSNVLCDVLVQTGLVGMKSLNDAGFFIGYGEGVKKAYEEGAVDAYFARNRTDNGVEGCKLGWDYVEHLNHNLAFGAVDDILAKFDKHLLVRRNNEVAQAVSRLIARQTGQWTSLDKRLDVVPQYSRDRISYFIAQNAGWEASVFTWLELHDIRPYVMSYESNAHNWRSAAIEVVEALEIPDEVGFVQPTLERQEDSIKEEWIERYLNGE